MDVRRNMTAMDEAMEGTTLQRFAPDLGVFATWHEGQSYFALWAYGDAEVREVEGWTHYGDDRGNPPTFDQASESIREYLDVMRDES